ncbi:armadillo-like helical protein [Babesia gibsoni]|uniref:Armadillo-like helical protein n=1 Tax=Babesia gibsoni TaxID=33632 RepID=A0AAD8LPT2_BABGI|nr:armadillo-like helical protein [Babesia gibsoni]
MVGLPSINMERLGLAPPKLKPGFFVDYRKGEVGEIRLLLRKMVAENKFSSSLSGNEFDEDRIKRREILKRLIRCMTLGIDVSRLYTDVVMISYTKDHVQKKMIYMFLSTYSKDNPDLAVLTINTLLKDVDSVDPVIRSLAIRNLSAFGTQLSNEYAKNAVSKKFHDPSDAVKRSAIIGSLRIYKSQCSLAKKGHIVDFDEEMYRQDVIPNVMASLKSLNLDVMFDAMCVYSDIMDVEDDIKLSKPTIVYMINRIKQMNEWEQCQLLKTLHTYTPSDDELFDLLNLLDGLLNYASSAVFLATAKCFLKWTCHDHMLQLEVVRRLERPMISLITQCCNEITYNLLVNILLLIVNAPQPEEAAEAPATKTPPFAEHYEVFFCRYDDPPYIKHVKINILVTIACESNSTHILHELNEYISDTNQEIATKAVKAIGVIALKNHDHVDMIVQQLSAIFTPRIPHLMSPVLYVICSLLRSYPDDANKLIKIVEDSKSHIKDPKALGYYIWILGEFGSIIQHAPYILEDIIDKSESFDISKELICATVKVFFKRAPEMFPALERLFVKVMNESQNPELTSLASFYYSLLSKDIDIARKVVCGNENERSVLTLENMMVCKRMTLYKMQVELGIPLPKDDWRDTFNTLDVFNDFQQKGNKYSRFFPFVYGNTESDIFTQGSELNEAPEEDMDLTPAEQIPMNDDALTTPNLVQEKRFYAILQRRLSLLNLVHPVTLLSEEYQKNWTECNKTCRSADNATAKIDGINTDSLEDMMLEAHIATLASGNNQGTTKLYQYAQDSEGHMYYIEVLMEPGEEEKWHIQVSVRTKDKQNSETFLQSMSDSICHCVKRWMEIID